MEKEELTRLSILRVMSYKLLHFLIKEKILSIFLTECLQNPSRLLLMDNISYGSMSQHELYEFEAYFLFVNSTTLSENKWWRYAFKYSEEYPW